MGSKYVIMCVGHTHTGKTTFARKLANDVSNLVIVDNDDLAAFVNKKYSIAASSPYNKIKRNFKEPNLKFLLSRNIFKFCLRAGLNIIQSSGNLGKDARTLIRNDAKKYHYNLITIYFNLPKSIILKRLSKTKKNIKCLLHSKNWPEVMDKQENYAQLPPSQKNTIYFEIKNNNDYKKVFKEVERLIEKIWLLKKS